MLTLKRYQQRVLDELLQFFTTASALNLPAEKRYSFAYIDAQQSDSPDKYRPIPGIENVPFFCIKVPTGGGKTLLATYSLKICHDTVAQAKNGRGLVMWFVPSDAIRTQTLNALRNPQHPYREALDLQYESHVKVFTIEEALAIQKHDLDDNLCIIVSSLAAFRRTDPTWLKVFQDNGSLLTHFENLPEAHGLDESEEGVVTNSLANVIKMRNPLVIVDEGHNAQTDLSFEMLKNINPSVVLEFTATPRAESNVFIQVGANELKAEKMAKLPIYLTNVPQWQEAIRDGLVERAKLEDFAKKERKQTEEYIRPIALLQAQQEKESPDKIYVEQIKEYLTEELKIDPAEIAIKTAKQDELGSTDLNSPDCPIRYIITVNALKEGWDCPFAYVLISVANIGSTVAVEQTIGRIMRLPYAREKQQLELNCSYVYTSSESFSKASSAVIKGLEGNGYSRDDLRENKGKVTPDKEEYSRAITDNDIAIPVLGLVSKAAGLGFSSDLLGASFDLSKLYKSLAVGFMYDQAARLKIDINEKGIVKDAQMKLQLMFHSEDFSEEELGDWLKRNVRHSAVSVLEMSAFIDTALIELLKEFKIDELSINRFRLKEYLQTAVAEIVQEFAKKTFDTYLKEKQLTTSKASYELPETILVSRPSDEHFQKHLFTKAGIMNGEETEFAFRIDGLNNVAWWYRNREKEDFYIQGWRQGKVYPDFIIKTKSGAYILTEYKGEDRLSNEDTAYKAEVGKVWQKLCDNKHLYYLVGKSSSDEIIKAIALI
jgi:superfamily II DNA or RNA helicase